MLLRPGIRCVPRSSVPCLSTARLYNARLAIRRASTATTDKSESTAYEPYDEEEPIKTDSKETLASADVEAGTGSLFKAPRHDLSKSAWAHPHFTMEEMKQVGVAFHTPKDLSDRIAQKSLKTIRSMFDWATGYKHSPPPGHENDPAYQMTPEKWMQRFVFLESVAGVPGMVGGMVRHLHSLRLLRRDRGWIESLLEEAYNERMHLLTFIQMTRPGWFMKTMLLGAQGVFFNCFFVAYLLSPKICHRFVGYLEEEAVVTYTRCLKDLEAGKYPEWEKTPVPEIALKYWKMPEDSTLIDLLYYIRADECKHREVNHTFGNLKQNGDRNPYAQVVDNGSPQPRKDLRTHNHRPVGWERDEIAA
uniref:Alternative oxidase n=1 Tax=Blastobotrys adeninivorans TaxID=409370 RepID=A0A060T3E8_BLAAD